MDIKTVKGLEIFGNVLGYIPGISTIAGAIKAFIYYNRSKGSIQPEGQQQMANTAGKIDETVRNINLWTGWYYRGPTVPVASAEKTIYEELYKNSLKEMIPFANIFYAIGESHFLASLNRVRDLKEGNFESNVDFVFERNYNVSPIDDKAKKEFMGHILIAIENIDIDDPKTVWRQPGYLNLSKEYLYSECFKDYEQHKNAKPTELLKVHLKKVIDANKASERARLSKPKPVETGLRDGSAYGGYGNEKAYNKASYDMGSYNAKFIAKLEFALKELG